MKKERSILGYFLSLPERLLRALAAGIGGFVYETSEVLLPDWLRRSRLYQAVIYRLLRLTIELVGGVENALPPDEVEVGELAKRKAAGNVIEFASFLAVGWSPLWLLAAAADLTGGARIYLRTLVSELQEDKLLPSGVDIASMDDLLNALENSSGAMADMVDVPPLNVQDLRSSWTNLQQNATHLPSAEQMRLLYGQLQQISRKEGYSLGKVSSLIASGAMRAGFHMGSAYIFDYYQNALRSIAAEGLPSYARRVTHPYRSTAVSHMNPHRMTYTDNYLGRLQNYLAKNKNKKDAR